MATARGATQVPLSSYGATAEPFQNALAKFRARLTEKELKDFQICKLQDVQQAIADIQERQNVDRVMRNFSRIRRFLEGMSQFGKVVEVFLNTSEIVAFVWGPLKFLLLVSSHWAESLDTLLDAYQQIGENLPLLAQYQDLFENSPHMTSVLEMIYNDILEFHQQALRMFGKPRWQQIFRAVWKDFDARFKHLIFDLQHHKNLVESQANVLEIQASKEARALAEKAYHDQDAFRKNDKRVAVRTWLSARNVNLDHETYITARESLPQTGLWVLQKTAIAAWHDNQHLSGSLVWMNGIPGAGKTILASIIVEKSKSLPSTITTYFYCKYKDPERCTFVAITRAILAQLLTQSKDTDLLQVLHEASVDSGERSLESQTASIELLQLAFGSISVGTYIHIIIDGLDECEAVERKVIISQISNLIKHDAQPGRIRAVFISQPETSIRTLLRTATTLRLTEADCESDIAEYTNFWCSKIQTKFGIDDNTRERIKSLVCTGAGGKKSVIPIILILLTKLGMFLFAKLVLQNLHRQISVAQLYVSLLPQKFPRGLDEAYGRILERIENNPNVSEREQALKLLAWVVISKRPLTWPEIQGAVSVCVDEEVVDFEHRSLVVDIEELCGTLIEKHVGDRIELIHTSAVTFLLKDGHLQISRAEGQLATLCLQYLMFPDFSSENNEILQLLKAGFYAFHNYSILHWVDHLQSYLESLQPKDLVEMENLAPLCEEFWADNGPKDLETFTSGLLEHLHISCKMAESQPSYHTFLKLIAFAREERKKSEDLLGLGRLGSTMELVRNKMEQLVNTNDSNSNLRLHKFYGGLFFKCPRHSCHYFHEGFEDISTRQEHLRRHDRPFCCDREGCSRIQTGFCTDADLQRHIKKNHAVSEAILEFLPKPQIRGEEVITEPATKRVKGDIRCRDCNRKFTRTTTLRDHMKIHTGEKPFACTVCGRCFAREKDRNRHYDTHRAEKLYVCGGGNQHGDHWGCGREFARLDALKRHHTSIIGWQCLSEANSAGANASTRMETSHFEP